MLPYNKDNIKLAKNLRKNMTPWENKLRYQFLRGYKPRFQRQKAIGNYIVDFYCARAKLIVELDGGGHFNEEQIKADLQRKENLENEGLEILRFTNLEVDRNFRKVCEVIDRKVKERVEIVRNR